MGCKLAICGLGVDIVSVFRIERMVETWGEDFLDRVFAGSELDYCLSKRRKYEHLAGRFAAKEAVIKATGRKLPWNSIEILSEKNGKPSVRFSLDGQTTTPSEVNMFVSITHQEDFALAVAIREES